VSDAIPFTLIYRELTSLDSKSRKSKFGATICRAALAETISDRPWVLAKAYGPQPRGMEGIRRRLPSLPAQP
jgi:hypothetical protein